MFHSSKNHPMKSKLYTLISFLLPIIILFFTSCETGKEKTKEVIVAKVEYTPTPTPATSLEKLMIIRHKVKNYKNWVDSYEAHDGVRIKYGLHNYLITRGLDDSNIVQVALRMDDFEKAKEFSKLANLKETMENGGVQSTPEFEYLDIKQYDTTSTGNISARVVMKHKVKDYNTWKVEFDKHYQVRKDAGLSDRLLAYSFENRNLVYVVCSVNDIKRAKDFFKSIDLKEKMKVAGVEEEPTMFFYSVSKKY